MTETKPYLLTLVCCLLMAWPHAQAEELRYDSATRATYRQYLTCYSDTGRDEEFYAASRQMQQFHLSHNDLTGYYKFLMNECLYDSEHQKSQRAIQTANAMLEDMKRRGVDRYDMVYTALGTVYESRGNTRIAMHYFMQAFQTLPHDDPGTMMGMCSRIAYLLMLKEPDAARNWNARYLQESYSYPPYHQVYLFIEAIIDFMKDDKEHFNQVYSQYFAYRQEHSELDDYGLRAIEIPRKYFDGDYREALRLLNDPSGDLNDLDRCDMRILILARNKQYEEALLAARQKGILADSLNSDMLFDNLNQINAEAGLARMQAETARNREHLFMFTFGSALFIILLLGVWIYNHRRMSRHLKEKNEQLKTALAMAEESDKMKTEFVRSVSHEIRTPLNAIAGFNEIINDPTMELPQEERQDLVSRIKDNVQAITDIVDEMLHLADQESQEFYARTDDILCNQFFSTLLYQYRDKVNSSIELAYTTRVINRFTIKSNEEGVKRIVDHLIQNAIKFTSKGHINVHCAESDDKKLLLVSVTDTGRGIAADKRDKIFEQFYKEDSFQQGIGLGLTVSRKLAQKLGGDLTFDDTYTTGARFVLSLPTSL